MAVAPATHQGSTAQLLAHARSRRHATRLHLLSLGLVDLGAVSLAMAIALFGRVRTSLFDSGASDLADVVGPIALILAAVSS